MLPSVALLLALMPTRPACVSSRASSVSMVASPPARRSVLAAAAFAATTASTAASDASDATASDAAGAWAEHKGSFDDSFFSGFESTPSGYVFKKVYVPSPPTAKPARPQGTKMGPFQRCYVHYTGYLLDGTKLDSSYGGSPTSFKLGKGKVIPGWEAIVGGMSVGMKVIVKIPAAQATRPHPTPTYPTRTNPNPP